MRAAPLCDALGAPRQGKKGWTAILYKLVQTRPLWEDNQAEGDLRLDANVLFSRGCMLAVSRYRTGAGNDEGKRKIKKCRYESGIFKRKEKSFYLFVGSVTKPILLKPPLCAADITCATFS